MWVYTESTESIESTVKVENNDKSDEIGAIWLCWRGCLQVVDLSLPRTFQHASEAKEDELPIHVVFLTRKYGEVQNGADHGAR